MNGFSIELAYHLLVSASAGALVGLVRQWNGDKNALPTSNQTDADRSNVIAGARTFSLWSMLGFISMYMHTNFIPYFAQISFVLFTCLLLTAQFLYGHSGKSFGLTSLSAGILTFIFGMLIFVGQIKLTMLLLTFTCAIIALKNWVHSWAKQITPVDIHALLQFAAITCVILPLLPNLAYGPLEAFNPFKVWLMVILISGTSFVGYLLMRIIGAKAGTMLTGLLGGLASSTATTLAFARQAKESPTQSATFGMAISLACSVMPLRVLFIVYALNAKLAFALLVPVLLLTLPCLLYFFLVKQEAGIASQTKLGNPLKLWTAIKFALLYLLIVHIVKASQMYEFGNLPVISFISGLTDMDAIGLSLTNMVTESVITIPVAVQGILIGLIANTLLKWGMAFSIGGMQLGKYLTLSLGLTIAIALGYLFWI